MMNWNNLLRPIRLHSSRLPNLKDIRSEYERDFDRIVFSYPFRRLQDKTQVHPMPVYDFVHNRLTHSLEVSSVARSLGKMVGLEVIARNELLLNEGYSNHDLGAIAAAAALAHDVGNPPFGHSGEASISDYFKNCNLANSIKDELSAHEWEDLTNFEGNAQGFRILTRPEEGLKLTLPVLASFTKYPCISKLENRDKANCSQKKYGFFKNEVCYFEQIADGLQILKVSKKENCWARHPLAFLVEAADDVCYSIIDLEDGCGLGLVGYQETETLLGAIMKDRFDRKKLNALTSKAEKLAVLRAISINVLVEEASNVFLNNEAKILNGEFHSALIDQVPSISVLSEIKSISIDRIYRSNQVLQKEAAGFEVIEGLMNSFTTATYQDYIKSKENSRRYQNALRLLPEIYLQRLTQATSLYTKLLVITDFISGLTDTNALQLFQTLKGISLPGK